MAKAPIISVAMPAYNCAAYLPAAIDSILDQTVKDFEFIIDTTGSTDDSTKVAADYAKKDKRIIHHSDSENKLMPTKLNRAIKVARGKYVARMDGDDISVKNRFELQLDYLSKHPEISVLGTNMLRMDEAGNTFNRYQIFPTHDEIVASTVQGISGMAHATVIMPTAALRAIGGYRTQFVSAEDYDLWLRLIRAGYRFANVDEPLYYYRRHTANATKDLWYEMSLLTVLMRLSHRDVLAGKPDPLEHLKKEDIKVELLRSLCHSPEEIINNHSGVLFGIVSQTAHKQNHDLMKQAVYTMQQMFNNAPSGEVQKNVLDFFAAIQTEHLVLPPDMCKLFFHFYYIALPLSRHITPEGRNKVLAQMVRAGLYQDANLLDIKWRQ
ncbi:MAG: glycosyltransferase [Alphaproteobacteria bacterium]|nr:glycosyltransferase [Alphaproteobacteria bacterium]